MADQKKSKFTLMSSVRLDEASGISKPGTYHKWDVVTVFESYGQGLVDISLAEKGKVDEPEVVDEPAVASTDGMVAKADFDKAVEAGKQAASKLQADLKKSAEEIKELEDELEQVQVVADGYEKDLLELQAAYDDLKAKLSGDGNKDGGGNKSETVTKQTA